MRNKSVRIIVWKIWGFSNTHIIVKLQFGSLSKEQVKSIRKDRRFVSCNCCIRIPMIKAYKRLICFWPPIVINILKTSLGQKLLAPFIEECKGISATLRCSSNCISDIRSRNKRFIFTNSIFSGKTNRRTYVGEILTKASC